MDLNLPAHDWARMAQFQHRISSAKNSASSETFPCVKFSFTSWFKKKKQANLHYKLEMCCI